MNFDSYDTTLKGRRRIHQTEKQKYILEGRIALEISVHNTSFRDVNRDKPAFLRFFVIDHETEKSYHANGPNPEIETELRVSIEINWIPAYRPFLSPPPAIDPSHRPANTWDCSYVHPDGWIRLPITMIDNLNAIGKRLYFVASDKESGPYEIWTAKMIDHYKREEP